MSQDQEAPPPTELDALLQKLDDDEQHKTQDEDNQSAQSSSHRKAHSVDVGSATWQRKSRRYPRASAVARGHRKQRSSISQLYDSLRNVNLEPIREDFLSTGEKLKTTFVGELDEMDRGETGFFDMTMTRSLSVIPNDISDLAHEAGLKASERADVHGPPIFQFSMLLSAVAAISSNSTALHMLDGVHPPLKLYWRMTASYIALSPMAIHYFITDGFPILTLSQWTTFVAAVLCYSIQNCLFYTSLTYTTIGNAVIYANSQALLLIIGKAFVGERIHILEALGVVVAFTGAILCSEDSERTSQGTDDTNDAIIGDFMALLSAVAGVGYLTFAKSIRAEMSVTVFIFCVMFVGSFCVLLFIHMEPNDMLEWNMNIYDGVFGWLSLDGHRIIILLYLAVVCNMVGTMGFVRGTSISVVGVHEWTLWRDISPLKTAKSQEMLVPFVFFL